MRLDGSMFTGEGRIRSTMWEGKKAFLVAIRDVTERNATQQALAESEQQHRQLVDANPNAVLVVVEGSIVFANKAAKEMLRETDGQRLVGCEAMELVPEEIRDDALRVRSEVSDGLSDVSAYGTNQRDYLREDFCLICVPFGHYDETEIADTSDRWGQGDQGHPLGNTQAILGRRKDPHCP